MLKKDIIVQISPEHLFFAFSKQLKTVPSVDAFHSFGGNTHRHASKKRIEDVGSHSSAGSSEPREEAKTKSRSLLLI